MIYDVYGLVSDKNEMIDYLIKTENRENTTLDDTPKSNVKSVENKNQDIYYIVRLKERYRQEFYLTTITKDFCGKIINQTSTNIYFELNGSNALVIIPHAWIEWLAPSKKLWEVRGENKNDN